MCIYEEEIKASIGWERNEQGGKGERKKERKGLKKKMEAEIGERG